jgi:hypothetical protein
VHRGEHGTCRYELAWRGEGEDGTPFLPGLTDPAELAAEGLGDGSYDPDRSPPGALRSVPAKIGSAPGRPPVGGRSATGRPAVPGASAQLTSQMTAFRPVITPERRDHLPVNGTRVVVIDPPAGGEG